MLSCRRVKAPLIFVPVLMHRETNLQVENEETIEAQSARTPKRCWTESNSAFSFVREFRSLAPRPCLACGARALHPSPRFLFLRSCHSAAIGTHTAFVAVRAYPVGVRKTRPLHSAFADRSVGKIGRQFSYKHNAEEGVRLDEQCRAMERGTSGPWCRSYGVAHASVCAGRCALSCGRDARSGATCRCAGGCAGRCVRIHCAIRASIRRCVRMNFRFFDGAPFVHAVGPAAAGHPLRDRCICIDRASRNAAFPRLLHADDIAAVHRGGWPSRRMRRRVRGAGGSRENERRRGMAKYLIY
ncbi:hypothetical protein BLA24064_05265 [Burkholderia latens]|uniref:Uncharacterized protein n=1 Tax=Burkholderia latens TaxID=488446 RepID=A0A6P2PTZ6_9BURK|nr:hypothetical protein BLA24064_05265 [Burkholderia latens]